MSIDLNWDTVTGGPDGLELAHKIRDFIHTKFQSVPLPRFIKSVTVHDFQFGSIPPEIELKDITDPLPDFYEENSDIDDSEDGSGSGSDDIDDDPSHVPVELRAATERRRRAEAGTSKEKGKGANTSSAAHLPHHLNFNNLGAIGGNGAAGSRSLADLGSPFLGVSTPGIFGATTSNLHYFHSQFANGLSGSQTPLAVAAGAHHLSNAWLDSSHGHSASTPNLRQQYAAAVAASHASPRRGEDNQPSHSRNPSQSSISIADFNPNANVSAVSSGVAGLGIGGASQHPSLREKHSVSTLAPTSAGTSRPPTRDAATLVGSAIAEDDDDYDDELGEDSSPGEGQRRFREPRVEDIQAVFRIKYAGDVKLLLTADILLDYPMPSFVGIPLRLSITGLTFDGVGVAAYIRKRVHFCFLSPEDALAAVGGEENAVDDGMGRTGGARADGSNAKIGGLLQEIRVESEIGQREGGKQSLKNVGKVERFVLEQVRRIFEEEFVYPSFWTFLV
ncbi:hypothetical protein B0T22DRAFT_453006 [Podospora appendiculata]|uniref:Mitochondrial distribution and morphology protein 12 n=1 Tax=Podospora appendiculata TaxID=314037 RepID=A0AAE0XJM8_9PEZI|nr:hypothetical protein B0T22DRAFT_453006 [Podospora appendiculata]